MPALTSDQILSRANALASQLASAQVPDGHLSLALTHLKRHRNVTATLTLLSELRRSSFARRNRVTPEQFRLLDETVRRALQGSPSWEDAAHILGWARRLVKFYG